MLVDFKKRRFERLNPEGLKHTGWCFEQVKVHKSRAISWFDEKKAFVRLNLEGRNIACDGIVEDDIVDGHILTRFTKAEKSVGLIKKKAFSEAKP
jgi:hypothetical protein